MTERVKALDWSCGVSVQQSVGSSPVVPMCCVMHAGAQGTYQKEKGSALVLLVLLAAYSTTAPCNSAMLKTLDTIGNCQRPVESLGVSQHMHEITNL